LADFGCQVAPVVICWQNDSHKCLRCMYVFFVYCSSFLGFDFNFSIFHHQVVLLVYISDSITHNDLTYVILVVGWAACYWLCSLIFNCFWPLQLILMLADFGHQVVPVVICCPDGFYKCLRCIYVFFCWLQLILRFWFQLFHFDHQGVLLAYISDSIIFSDHTYVVVVLGWTAFHCLVLIILLIFKFSSVLATRGPLLMCITSCLILVYFSFITRSIFKVSKALFWWNFDLIR
jgi:hypothetical protein